MLLKQPDLLHLNTIVHETKVVVFATLADGSVVYTIRQDGYEDNYGTTTLTGWENWRTLEFPDEADDTSVTAREAQERTIQASGAFLARSRYRTAGLRTLGPVQLVSGLGHLYVFRHASQNGERGTLLVDRFVLDGLTNTLVRKLEVRYKRSRKRYEPLQRTSGSGTAVSLARIDQVDSYDYRDADGKPFYEPSTELSLIDDLRNGWFSVVLVPTDDHDHARWHMFYANQHDELEIVSLPASEDGLFQFHDEMLLEASPNGDSALLPRLLPAITRQRIAVDGQKITGSPAATRYDVQTERQTRAGLQLLRDTTRVMVAVPTAAGPAVAFDFALGADGTLSRVAAEQATPTPLRSSSRDVLLPLDTLDNIRAFGPQTPLPSGTITRMQRVDDSRLAVVFDAPGTTGDVMPGSVIEISGTHNYNGRYTIHAVDGDSFVIEARWQASELGRWEVLPDNATSLVFDGMLTSVERLGDGTLRITAPNHGLAPDDEVQITGTADYNGNFVVLDADPHQFTVNAPWLPAEALSLKMVANRRRGVMFSGEGDYLATPAIDLPAPADERSWSHTYQLWMQVDTRPATRQLLLGSLGRADDQSALEAQRADLDTQLAELQRTRAELSGSLGDPAKLERELAHRLELEGYDPVGTFHLVIDGTSGDAAQVLARVMAVLAMLDASAAQLAAQRDELLRRQSPTSPFALPNLMPVDPDIQRQVEELNARLQHVERARAVVLSVIGVLNSSVNAGPTLAQLETEIAQRMLDRDALADQLAHAQSRQVPGHHLRLVLGENGYVALESELAGSIDVVSDPQPVPVATWIHYAATLEFDHVAHALSLALYRNGVRVANKVVRHFAEYARLRATADLAMLVDKRLDTLLAPGNDWSIGGWFYPLEKDRSGILGLLPGQWQYLAISYRSSGDEAIFYCDGKQIRTGRSGDVIQAIGALSQNNSTPLDLAELALWNRVRTAAEIAADMRRTPPAGAPGLAWLWTGSDAPDAFKGGDDPIRIDGQAWTGIFIMGGPGDASAQNGGWFVGRMAEVQLWDRARAEQDIFDNLVLPLQGREVGLAAYWRLGAIVDGPPRRVMDFSPAGNDAEVHGQLYVGAARLSRRLGDNQTDAVRYTNDDLVAVTQRGTYRETFEFRLDPPVEIATSDAAPDRQGMRPFTLSYWGRRNRTSQDAIAIGGATSFEALGDGWYRAIGSVTIPDDITLLRVFELSDLAGAWETLDIRRHRVELVSDSISLESYASSLAVDTIAAPQAGADDTLEQIGEIEPVIADLYAQKRRLQRLLATPADNSQAIAALQQVVDMLTRQVGDAEQVYNREKANVFNYWCSFTVRSRPGGALRVYTQSTYLIHGNDPGFDSNGWRFSNYWFKCVPIAVDAGNRQNYAIISAWQNRILDENYNNENRVYGNTDHHLGANQQFRIEPFGDGSYAIVCRRDDRVLDQGGGEFDVLCYGLHGGNNQRWMPLPIKNPARIHETGYVGEIWSHPTVANPLTTAYESWQNLLAEQARQAAELQRLRDAQTASDQQRATWQRELENVNAEIARNQERLAQLTPPFVAAAQAGRPATWPTNVEDTRGLATRAALLAFVVPRSRMQLSESASGNLLLTYADTRRRLRQTLYDAAADSRNSSFEQWLPDRARTCLDLSSPNRTLTVEPALTLGDAWTLEAWFWAPLPPDPLEWNTLFAGGADRHVALHFGQELGVQVGATFYPSGFRFQNGLATGWHHLAVVGSTRVSDGSTEARPATTFYIDGAPVGSVAVRCDTPVGAFGNARSGNESFGKIAELRIWNVALNDDEVAVNSKTLLTGNEPGLVAYYPLDELGGLQAHDHGPASRHAAASHDTWQPCTAMLTTLPDVKHGYGLDGVVSAEYSTVTVDRFSGARQAIMRRFLAYVDEQGVMLLPDKRVEALELRWIGNAQFQPTLLGYIEGAPPVPSENLTVQDNLDYNGATSVELTMSSDTEYSWTRDQDIGLGGRVSLFAGADSKVDLGVGAEERALEARQGFQGDLSLLYDFLNSSSVSASSGQTVVDRLELRGGPEPTARFEKLGRRFIPKNIGYALVVSGLADVFISRLARSGRMVGYQVIPNEDIGLDINTITFLMNPAYTMNGSLDGLTGSAATSDRFFRQVPELRAQYGSQYPASYYRLAEAYDLKRQIENADKARESYFKNFNSRLVDALSLDREIGASPSNADQFGQVTLNRQEDRNADGTALTDDQRRTQLTGNLSGQRERAKQESQDKQKEIESKIKDLDKQVNASAGYAYWQTRMEDLQIRAGKRNIVNTYVWDADGGLRAENQQFASTIEHTVGGSFNLEAGIGGQGAFKVFGVGFELSAQAQFKMTQTLNKTETRSKGFSLDVNLDGVEHAGVTDYNDYPLLPGEKVDRYRFMSFYLDGSTNHFYDFFNFVVDPEWLASNDEEARALRQTMAGKANKAWRVLHRVTYVERPALMGIGRDTRPQTEAASKPWWYEAQQRIGALQSTIDALQRDNDDVREKLDRILNALEAAPHVI